ncbi:uncharacterized protein LOC111712331 [Eurytemora carolleeae]|uniref:uncharacterized protein LOC111712331 n=1 Tax=Eurytemora carolleeae TaxID=1294199 RepID=UPI000C781BF5|nr:uncharacterized protein LOC111712331 [Eurytemora carolleeae]|eukprot:XP_023342674.1 uncharacterized protein LOC111712331 [Eurytemora affinis]
MNEKIKPYLIIKIILGVLILIADFVVGVRLLSGGYLLWGLLTLGCILTGVLVSLLVVCLGRCSTGDSMSCSKFTILTLKVHAELTGAFFHSGPQIVVQLAVFWSGIYSHDLQVYTEPGTSSWMFAWAEILSPALNFISLVYTG